VWLVIFLLHKKTPLPPASKGGAFGWGCVQNGWVWLVIFLLHKKTPLPPASKGGAFEA
jgi:hypothetical protein